MMVDLNVPYSAFEGFGQNRTELMHYGVKGMKWGVRKDTKNAFTSFGKKVGKSLGKAMKTGYSKMKGAAEKKHEWDIKRGKVSKMSDEQLKKYLSRKQMEKQVKDLKSQLRKNKLSSQIVAQTKLQTAKGVGSLIKGKFDRHIKDMEQSRKADMQIVNKEKKTLADTILKEKKARMEADAKQLQKIRAHTIDKEYKSYLDNLQKDSDSAQDSMFKLYNDRQKAQKKKAQAQARRQEKQRAKTTEMYRRLFDQAQAQDPSIVGADQARVNRNNRLAWDYLRSSMSRKRKRK